MATATMKDAPAKADDGIERACERLRDLDRKAQREQLWGHATVTPIYQDGRIIKIDFEFKGGEKLG